MSEDPVPELAVWELGELKTQLLATPTWDHELAAVRVLRGDGLTEFAYHFLVPHDYIQELEEAGNLDKFYDAMKSVAMLMMSGDVALD